MSNNKSFNNQQLQKQEKKQIQRIFENEKQKIQQQVGQNNNIIQLQILQEIQDKTTIKKCNYCNYQGTNDLMLKHIKNCHKEEYLNSQNNSEKYSICQTCNKTFLKKNIQQHQFVCRVKENNKKTSKAMNKINKLIEKNINYNSQSSENSNNFYNNLLSKFQIKVDETIDESEESNSIEQDFEKSLERSKLFNQSVIKKRKIDIQDVEEKSTADRSRSDISLLRNLENLNFDNQEE